MQTLENPNLAISFRVDDVEQSNEKLPTCLIKDSLLNNIGRKEGPKDISMSKMGSPPGGVYEILRLSCGGEVLKQGYKGQCNSLLHAVNVSFNSHLPLTFSPDIIWNTILLGISQHVRMHQDSHKEFLVKGGPEVRIARPDLNIHNVGENIESVVDDFIAAMGGHTSKIHLDLLTEGFSTTLRAERVSSLVACMDVFSPFLSYVMYCGCGFPEIKLTGSKEDWSNLYNKILKIEELFYINDEVNLTWWTEKLKIISAHFVKASLGEPDIEWWQKMYKQKTIYLAHAFNGWIGQLFPYIKDRGDEKWIKNPILNGISDDVNNESLDWGFSERNEKWDTCGFLGTDQFPLGLSSVDLKVVDLINGAFDLKLIGGLLGVKQENDGGLVPILGYGLLK